MSVKKFCIIGLGYFGANLALDLTEEGAEVVAVDIDVDKVAPLKDKVTMAVQADATDPRALEGLGISEVDAVIVAIGEGFESSITTTAALQEIGVKKIINRIISPVHERLLKLMGIKDLIVPEAYAANKMAERLMIPGLIESFEITKEYGIFEVAVPEYLIGKSLTEVELRQKFDLNLVTVKRKAIAKGIFTSKEEYIVTGVPEPTLIFQKNDILVLFGKEKNFIKLLD
jgi:trk system potassium uptake protein TrkA